MLKRRKWTPNLLLWRYSADLKFSACGRLKKAAKAECDFTTRFAVPAGFLLSGKKGDRPCQNDKTGPVFDIQLVHRGISPKH